jgi:hypothetical protein
VLPEVEGAFSLVCSASYHPKGVELCCCEAIVHAMIDCSLAVEKRPC